MFFDRRVSNGVCLSDSHRLNCMYALTVDFGKGRGRLDCYQCSCRSCIVREMTVVIL